MTKKIKFNYLRLRFIKHYIAVTRTLSIKKKYIIINKNNQIHSTFGSTRVNYKRNNSQSCRNKTKMY